MRKHGVKKDFPYFLHAIFFHDYKQQLDEVFVISGMLKVGARAEADYTCRYFVYSGYHKNRIQLLFLYTLFYRKCTKLLCEMQVDFISASKLQGQTQPSSRITQNHSRARALKPRVYYACALRAV